MENHGPRGVVWPVLLIGGGLILLLNNLSYLSWDIWGVLWRLWPVLLIAAGLEILIGRRSLLGSAVVAFLLLITLLGAIFWGMQQQPTAPAALTQNATRGAVSTVRINQPLEGAASADIKIGMGAGQLRLEALPESSGLVEGQIELRSGEQVEPVFQMRGDRADFALVNDKTILMPTLGQWDGNAAWELSLSRDIPIALDVTTGVGASNLDLSQLDLEQLNVETGVGSTQLYLPRRGRLSATVSTGVGELDVIIPTGMAARIRVDGGLSNVNVSGKDYRHEENVYISSGFDDATDRIDLAISAGIGQITIR